MPSYSLPGAGTPRPSLPDDLFNPRLKELESNIPAVKFQEIVRDGQSTIVARMKIPTTSGGHAFILRRLDTGAVSLTTMYRAAFPNASEAAEREESAWVRANFDVAGANRTGKARFAGTWVSESTAREIAPSYKLQNILLPLLQAEPDPNVEYRKSSRAQQDSPARQLPTPDPSFNRSPAPTPSAPKRRRDAPPEAAPTPASTPVAKVTAKPPPSAVKVTPVRTGARRSTRVTSPAPAPVPQVLVAPKTPRSPRKPQAIVTTPAGSDETVVEEEEEEVVELGGPDMARDIAEQKELIESFKAQRRAAEAADSEMSSTENAPRKRDLEQEEAPPSFNFKEPEEIVRDQDRQIATNRRLSRLPEMTPERRSLAWGLGAFTAAAAAVSFLPNPWF